MSPRHEEVFDLCAGYVLGSLDATERRSLEDHLAEGCTQCDAELRRLGAGASLLAASAPSLRAPAALRDRVISAVRAEPRASSPAGISRRADPHAPLPLRPPARRRVSIATWTWAAAATLIAIAGALQWRAATRMERNLADTRGQLEQLRQQLEEERRWASLPDAPQAMVVRLSPTPDGSPQLSGRVLFDPATRRAVVALSNFVAPTGKDYQLWAISKSGPSSLGLVRADSTGRAVVRLPDVGEVATLTAFAVSLEQKGGAPTPNAPAGPVVMIGKIGG